MSAADLRQAAETLRARAAAATGEWHPRDDWYRQHEIHHALTCIRTATDATADATYITTMHPGVGLALADWLDKEATFADTADGFDSPHALVVARLINGGAS